MNEDIVRKVQANAKYQELVKKRTSFGWLLTALIMIVYYGYILIIAFDKEILGKKIGEGVMTWGIPVGFGIIVFTVIITGIYVRRANSEFDDMTKDILREVK